MSERGEPEDAVDRPHDGEGPRLRVLLVGHGPPVTGGIPSFVQGLLEDARLRRRVDYAFVNTAPSDVERPGGATASNARRLAADAVRVWRRAGGVDVVHLNVAPAPELPLARALVLVLAARARRRPVVLHAHSGRMHAFVERRGYRTLLRAALAAVDAFVVVSETERAAIERAAGRAAARARVRRIENAVDVAAFVTGPKERPPELVFVGTVCERKGLIDLRDALTALEREGAAGPGVLAVTIVGDGRQEGPGAFERVRAAYAGAPWVRFTGALSPDDVRAVLGHASIFCLPSHWEGSPLSVLEAMASRAAIVASNVGDVPHILDDGRAGIVVPARDATSLAAAIRALVSSDDRRAALAAAARERAEASYDRGRLSKDLLALYDEVVTRGSRARGARTRSRARPRT